MACNPAAFFHIALAALIVAVSAKDLLHIIEAPANVDIIACQDQGCQADVSDIATVAAAAALEGPPDHKVPWIGAFGISPRTRLSDIIAVVYDGESTFPMNFKSSYPLLFTESSQQFMDENGEVSLGNEELKVTQINVQEFDTESSLSAHIEELKRSMGKSVLVVGVHVPKSESRSRRAADDAAAANGTDSGATAASGGGSSDTPSNLFNYSKEGGAAPFEIGIWTAILSAVAVYFICLYIMKIDEGNDSIIYKATAAKMGKRD